MGSPRDLQAHIALLEAKGKLVRVQREINKDTELMPLVRWQFRGLPEAQRKAFLFENVVDVNGRKYPIPVVVGALAASREIYALGMDCLPGEIQDRWTKAQSQPIEPVLIEQAPVQEVVHQGDDLRRPGGGMDLLPVPISTPGLDIAPYTTDSHIVTKDPETGERNMGDYRGQVKGRDAFGIDVTPNQHIGFHWKKAKRMGIPLQAAIVIGLPPSVAFCSVSKLPHGVDEFAVAGGIAGEAIELAKCKTVGLEVPARAQIVIEGVISTEYLEPEAPFGEYTGYMGHTVMNPRMRITAITHQRNPVFAAILSQFPPSESSKIKQIGFEAVYYKFLHHDCNIPAVQQVVFPEESGSSMKLCVIQLKKTHAFQTWQALNGATALDASTGKIIIAVDDDIDPRDPDAVNWALCFRMQPHQDVRITMGKTAGLDPSTAPPTEISRADFNYPWPHGGSAMLIDATRKYDYPPVSLPLKEYMEGARKIWEELGLPPLTPKVPWHGYPLGYWPEQDQRRAQLALQGKHYQVGEEALAQQIKIR